MLSPYFMIRPRFPYIRYIVRISIDENRTLYAFARRNARARRHFCSLIKRIKRWSPLLGQVGGKIKVDSIDCYAASFSKRPA